MVEKVRRTPVELPVPDGPIHRTAQAAVAAQLRREILTGKISPGTRLLQNAVAQKMRTSTTPVREAMRELAAEGLLDLDPHRGVVVHEPTVEELKEVYEIRLLLEPTSIAKAVERITDEELLYGEALCDRMERETDPAAWSELNGQYHGVIAAATRGRLLTQLLANLRNRSALYVALSLIEDSNRLRIGNEEHRMLLDACKARDPDQAAEVTRQHLESTVGLGLRSLSQRPPAEQA